jgi:hypothetical protein
MVHTVNEWLSDIAFGQSSLILKCREKLLDKTLPPHLETWYNAWVVEAERRIIFVAIKLQNRLNGEINHENSADCSDVSDRDHFVHGSDCGCTNAVHSAGRDG